MTTNAIPTMTRKLEKPEDWRPWYDEVKSYANNLEVLPYVNVDSDEDPEIALVANERPPKPAKDVGPFEGNAAQQRAAARQADNDYTNLLRAYSVDLDLWKHDLNEYKETRRKLESLKNRITASISSHLQSLTADEKTLLGKMKVLKQYSSHSKGQEINLTHTAWERLMGPPNRGLNATVWAEEVLRTYRIGKIIGNGFVQDKYRTIISLTHAISRFSPRLGTSLRTDIEDDFEEGKELITVQKAMHRFQQAIINDKITTFQKEETPEEEPKERPTLKKREAPKGDQVHRNENGKRRRTDSGESPTRKCYCQARWWHPLDDCWALHPQKKPKDIPENTQVQSYQKEALEKARKDPKVDTECIASIERVAKERAEPSEE
jgi:hypothetical protein